MPSPLSTGDSRVTRRRILGGVGTVVSGGLAGCSSRLPGSDPEEVDAETTVEEDDDPRLLWRYPPRDGETDGIGYAAVEVERLLQRESLTPAIRLNFNSTVGGIASAEPYEGYSPDWFRFRIWPPTTYEGRLQHEVRVEPPGQWERFSAYYDIRDTVRRTTVELRNVGTQGTVQIPAVFDSGTDPLPDRLHCSFTVQASRSGFLGKTVRVTDQDTLPLQQ